MKESSVKIITSISWCKKLFSNFCGKKLKYVFHSFLAYGGTYFACRFFVVVLLILLEFLNLDVVNTVRAF